MIHVYLFEAFALALFYSCFCRASYTHKANTKRDVRWAFTYLGFMALLCVLAPFWGYDPDGLTVAILGSITVVQLVTAHHWRKGIPLPFKAEP